MIELPEYVVPFARPREGSAGKTGTWRTSRPVIDYHKCTKCRLCVIYCVENTIDLMPDMYPKIDYDYCKGCGVCATVCPQEAIVMEPEVK